MSIEVGMLNEEEEEESREDVDGGLEVMDSNSLERVKR